MTGKKNGNSNPKINELANKDELCKMKEDRSLDINEKIKSGFHGPENSNDSKSIKTSNESKSIKTSNESKSIKTSNESKNIKTSNESKSIKTSNDSKSNEQENLGSPDKRDNFKSNNFKFEPSHFNNSYR